MERTWIPSKDLKDFTSARYTAIISDLHLCEAEPVNRKYPLWKKYKTRQFFFDTDFRDFLAEIEKLAKGEPIELIFNGDTFDFDSVTKTPKDPPYRLSRIEKTMGLFSQSDKSVFKIKTILNDHPIFMNSLRDFVGRGHRIVFVIGNHDLEMIWPDVQRIITKAICPRPELQENVRFCEFFYISNQDTLVEHGHQYDPYCRAEDPIHPFVLRYNRIETKIPFGNLACRYMINAMGFFNPYTESNYIMSVREYARFFFRYIARAQPLLILTWLRGATLTMAHTLRDRLRVPLKDPMVVEERIEEIARRSNSKARVVRELRELAVPSAASQPFQIARELWLDRAVIVLLFFLLCFQGLILVKQVFELSFFWLFIPLLLFTPFFIFYSASFQSKVASFKEPKENILATAGYLTGTRRVVYGHTHIVRHEIIGPIEHLNSGTWSPAFKDVDSTQIMELKTFVWLSPQEPSGDRRAQMYMIKRGKVRPFLYNSGRQRPA